MGDFTMFTARMFGLAKLFSKEHKPSPKRNFKPQLESLEKREVMSASSLSLHAVTDVYGNNLAVFEGTSPYEGNQFTGLIFSTNQLGNAGAQSNLIPTGIANTPNSVASFSLGLDANGRGDLFVKATDGSFWDLSEHGWVKLQTPGNIQVESFAAVDGGRVYAIFQDGSLNVFTPTGVSNSAPAPYIVLPPPGTQPFGTWEHVYGAGSVTALDAVTDKYGYDAVFVENADKSFGEFYSPNSGSLPVPAGPARATLTGFMAARYTPRLTPKSERSVPAPTPKAMPTYLQPGSPAFSISTIMAPVGLELLPGARSSRTAPPIAAWHGLSARMAASSATTARPSRK
jgi:hypothetical protein